MKRFYVDKKEVSEQEFATEIHFELIRFWVDVYGIAPEELRESLDDSKKDVELKLEQDGRIWICESLFEIKKGKL